MSDMEAMRCQRAHTRHVAVTDGENIMEALKAQTAVVENTQMDAGRATRYLKHFIGEQQLGVIGHACYGEEKQYFYDQLVDTAALIEGMPHTYQQDGKGKDAIVYLHYFRGGMDWYIIEKDMGDDTDDKNQYQAFGIANLGYGGELGYISIKELIENNIELDMHFIPRSREELGV